MSSPSRLLYITVQESIYTAPHQVLRLAPGSRRCVGGADHKIMHVAIRRDSGDVALADLDVVDQPCHVALSVAASVLHVWCDQDRL